MNFHFYCVQPIQINQSNLVDLFLKKIDENCITEFKSDHSPCWSNDFNKDLFQSLYSLKLETNISATILQKELETNFKISNLYSLEENLNIENSSYYLLFDVRLMYFNLVFELDFDIKIGEIDKLFKYDKKLKDDFYNTVRKMLVKEEQDSQISEWATSIRSCSLNCIHDFISRCYDNYHIPSTHLLFENNTGNISCFVNTVELSNPIHEKQFNTKIITLNNDAERIKPDKHPIILNSLDNQYAKNSNEFTEELYHFCGRFHTVISKKHDDQKRIMPINFHMQFMWFYLKSINVILETNYNKFLFSGTLKSIEKHTDITNSLINKIETLIIHNEKFKLVIESDNQRIYQNIEKDWNISNLLTNSERYIKYFKEHLNRLYSKKSSKAEQRQNSILISITILQFIALLSVWNDYLSLLNDDVIDNAKELTNTIITPDLLANINLYLPIIFLIFIALMFIYIFKRPS